jgi:hypothetical protein
MKILIILILLVLGSVPSSTAPFFTANPGKSGETAKRTILLLSKDPMDIPPTIAVENLYISSQTDRSPLIAFYLEDEQHVMVYDTIKQKVYRFRFAVPGKSRTESTSAHFITICWDQQKYGDFAVILASGEKNWILSGSIHGNERKLKNVEAISNKTGKFVYRNGVMMFLDLGRNKIESIGGRLPFHSREPSNKNHVIVDFKMPRAKNRPYFCLLNKENSNCGIYSGEQFEMAVDSNDFDELYPHVSANGRLLGYIETNRNNGSSRICLKPLGKPVIKSNFTFALDENALRREYSRMYFIGDELCFYAKHPDLKSRDMPYGLFILSAQKEALLRDHQISLVSSNESITDLWTHSRGIVESIWRVPSVRDVIPVEYNGKRQFIYLSGKGKFQVKFKNGKLELISPQSELLVISNTWLSNRE